METTLTKTQQKQVDYLDRMEPCESLSYIATYSVVCHTCKASKEFHAVDSVRAFILSHKGHKTWVQYFGKVNSC